MSEEGVLYHSGRGNSGENYSIARRGRGKIRDSESRGRFCEYRFTTYIKFSNFVINLNGIVEIRVAFAIKRF